MLARKIASVRYPMQELELNYPTTKGKVYSEDEDRYLLCRLNFYKLRTEDVYERIRQDISEFPVFRFDWFFKSRTPAELQRRCNTLLGLIEKEMDGEDVEDVEEEKPAPPPPPPAASAKGGAASQRGKKRAAPLEDGGGLKSEKASRAPTPALSAAGAGSASKRPSKKKKV